MGLQGQGLQVAQSGPWENPSVNLGLCPRAGRLVEGRVHTLES